MEAKRPHGRSSSVNCGLELKTLILEFVIQLKGTRVTDTKMIHSFEQRFLFSFGYFGGIHTGDKPSLAGFNKEEHAFLMECINLQEF